MPWEIVGLKSSWEVGYSKLVEMGIGTCPLRPSWPVSHSSTPTCLGEKHKGTQWNGTVQPRTRLRETILDIKWLCDPVQVTSVSVTSLLR